MKTSPLYLRCSLGGALDGGRARTTLRSDPSHPPLTHLSLTRSLVPSQGVVTDDAIAVVLREVESELKRRGSRGAEEGVAAAGGEERLNTAPPRDAAARGCEGQARGGPPLVAWHLEPYDGRSAATLREDLGDLMSRFGSSLALARFDRRRTRGVIRLALNVARPRNIPLLSLHLTNKVSTTLGTIQLGQSVVQSCASAVLRL